MAIRNNAQGSLDPLSKAEAWAKNALAKGRTPDPVQVIQLQAALKEATEFVHQLPALGISDVSSFQTATPQNRARMLKDAASHVSERHEQHMQIIRSIPR